ncbi:uncharacterized protein LOC134820593 isoform X2 [Bolinopsis microptera]|uniref:uncharacterized protein LOC134820593 isoform X2 n=1 Tax=Bolinopsis microptera TaxID=2820187 RepID=UPI00307AE5B7
MYDVPTANGLSPIPSLDCKFARTCIYLSFKGLNLRQKLSFEERCQKVQEEVRKLMSKNTFVPDIPCFVYQQICGELDLLRSSRRQDFTEICEVFSPPAWLRLATNERAAHQLLSRPCYACIQHNINVYNKFVTTAKKATPPPVPNSSLSQTKTSPNDDLMLQLRELIRPSVADSNSSSEPSDTSNFTPLQEPDKMSEQEASLLAALTALPSTTLDRMINLLSQSTVKQESGENETLVCRATTQSLYHQTHYTTSAKPQNEFQNQKSGSKVLSFAQSFLPSQRLPQPGSGDQQSLKLPHFREQDHTSPRSLAPQLFSFSSPVSASSGDSNTKLVLTSGNRTSNNERVSSTSQTCFIPVSPRFSSSQIVSPRLNSSQLVSTRLKVDAMQPKDSSPRLKLQDLSNVPANGVWIVRSCKALFELSVGCVINTAVIAEKEKAPSRNHVAKLAQILGLETRMVEHQEILSGFRMFKNSASFDLNFASQIAKVTIHQLLDGSCKDKELTILCAVISDVIMQAFSLHRDTPPMTVAKIIMIQGSPLLPNSVQLSPPDSSSRSSRPSSGSNSSGDTVSNSRKRRKVISGASKRSPKQKTPTPSSTASTSGTSSITTNFSETVSQLVGHLSKSTLDLLQTGNNLSYTQVADLASAMTDNLVKNTGVPKPKPAVTTNSDKSCSVILPATRGLPAPVTKFGDITDKMHASSPNVDSTKIHKHLEELIASVETDVALVDLVKQLPNYRRAYSLGCDVGGAFRRVELLNKSVIVSDSLLMTTALVATVNNLTSKNSLSGEESVNVEDVVHEITSKNRKFLCELITSLTFPEMAVHFKENTDGKPLITMESINKMNSRLNEPCITVEPLSKSTTNGTDNPENRSAPPASPDILINLKRTDSFSSEFFRGSEMESILSFPMRVVESNEDDDMAVAERLHYLITEVVQSCAT